MKLSDPTQPAPSPTGPLRNIVILGGGSAGLLTAVGLSKHLPDARLQVVRSSKMGVIGVGEGTIATIGRFLHGYLQIDPVDFHQQVHPSIKLGIQFDWGSELPYHYSFSPQFSAANRIHQSFPGPVGFYCQEDARFANLASCLMTQGKVASRGPDGSPVLPPRFAYHLENKRFVNFLESFSDTCGIEKLDALVERVEVDQRGVQALVLDNGQSVTADLFIDCSGFRSELLGKALQEPFVSFKEALFCDRAVVGGWTRSDETYHAFTRAEAMESGWCWQIEHDTIINRGYVYSADFISDQDAETEFRQKNPRVTDTRVIQFNSGVYRRSWVKNVVAIGNSAGFVEPLEATAIGFISSASDQLISLLQSCAEGMTDIHRDLFNRQQETNWNQTRDFLALHYQPNRLSRTPFWRACRHDLKLGDAQDILDFYQVSGPDFRALDGRLRSNIFGAEGYLSILVGQNVPYRRQPVVSEAVTRRWNDVRSRWSALADEGVDMADYLGQVRSGKLPFMRAAQASP